MWSKSYWKHHAAAIGVSLTYGMSEQTVYMSIIIVVWLEEVNIFDA